MFTKLRDVVKGNYALFLFIALSGFLTGITISYILHISGALKAFVLFVLLSHYLNALCAQFLMFAGMGLSFAFMFLYPSMKFYAWAKRRKMKHDLARADRYQEIYEKYVKNNNNLNKIFKSSAKGMFYRSITSTMATCLNAKLSSEHLHSSVSKKDNVQDLHTQLVLSNNIQEIKQAGHEMDNMHPTHHLSMPEREAFYQYAEKEKTVLEGFNEEEVSLWDYLEDEEEFTLDHILDLFKNGLEELQCVHQLGYCHGFPDLKNYAVYPNTRGCRLMMSEYSDKRTGHNQAEDIKIFVTAFSLKIRCNMRELAKRESFSELCDIFDEVMNSIVPMLQRTRSGNTAALNSILLKLKTKSMLCEYIRQPKLSLGSS